MKQAALLLSIGWLYSCISKADTQAGTTKNDTLKYQSSVADSFAYMKEIVANKQKYIHQPLSTLLTDLKVPVQSYYIRRSSLFKSKSITLYFDDSYDTIKLKWNKPERNDVAIIVEWISPLSIAPDLHTPENNGQWTAAEQKYFKDEIVKDVIVPFRRQY